MNEARQSMVHRLKMVEREKENLEGARPAAEAYLDKDRECTEAQCNIYQASFSSCLKKSSCRGSFSADEARSREPTLDRIVQRQCLD